MTARPRIAEVSCSPARFGPGDRVLVATSAELEADARARLRRSVARWAGVEEERVLVYCKRSMSIEVERGLLGPTGLELGER